MPLSGENEYVIITLGCDRALRGLRLLRKKGVEIAAWASLPPDPRPLAERLDDLGRRVAWRKSAVALIAPAVPESVFFVASLPAGGGVSARKLVGSALEFEAPLHMLRQGVVSRNEFIASPSSDGSGNQTLETAVWSVPEGALDELFGALVQLRRPVDAVLSPYMALTATAAGVGRGGTAYFADFDPGFFWRDGSFHPVEPGLEPDNAALTDEMCAFYRAPVRNQAETADGPDSGGDVRRDGAFLPALVLGKFAVANRQRGQIRSLELVPRQIRPQRLRSQLRLTFALGAALILGAAVNSFDAVAGYHREYSRLRDGAAALKTKTAAQQRRLSSRSKELKEMNRILDMNLDQRALIPLIGQLCAALPDNVLVTRLQLSENSIDIAMNTVQENLDLAESLRRIAGFKVANLQNRKVNDTLSMITLKLNRQEAKDRP